VKVTTTTPKPAPSTTKKPVNFDLPDEVPDDLRQQLLSSGILENAQISILDYDKIGETNLNDLPAEHLANFFNAGGAAQIGASNKVISVLKPNGDSVDEKIKTLKNDKEVTKILENAKKLPSKKDDVNLKVVRFDSNTQKNIHEQYIQKDSKILPAVNIDQNNYNRYLPLKINGAQFPIPDVEELRGKKISSVVVLAPVNGDQDDSRQERDTIETKKIKFIAGDSLKNLLRKPSTDNFKKWLEKEQKTNPDLQSVVLLVTK
jgi:kinesin family protein 13